MQFDVFVNFDGNCREAAEFYARVFRTKVQNLMTYAQAPADPNSPVAPADMDKVMYAEIGIGNVNVMFMDMPSGMPLIRGNNITPTISLEDKREIERLFNELQEGGTVEMDLQQTFYSELYGMVTDKFGIIWQILHYARAEQQG